MSQKTLYIIGLVLVLLYLVMGTDDLIWDLASLFRRWRQKEKRLNMELLNATPPKLLAVAVAAWHEDNVLYDVIENMICSVQYPRSMYHVFLGVYPNDDATIAVAEALASRYHNVHVVINELPGPTSKAQNLNYVIRQIHDFEEQYGWQFQSLTVHDSEDVIHPEELKVTNCLLDTFPAIQFPVFPLMEMPKFRNFFKNITTNTYADEFAENHFTTMVNRREMGAFVPSAGTGFVLSRKVIEAFGCHDVLPRDSLTEDYRLSLTLHEMGIPLYYALEKVPRLKDNGKLRWDYIATRSRFPDTFRTAVRQKTRWILGITMQSFKFRDVFKTRDLNFVSKYSLYKDSKAKVGNLLSMIGYPVLIYFLASLFIDLVPIYPKYSLSWWLSCVVTFMMLERQLFRSVALYNIYGMRTVFFSVLFPPLFPLRLIWGNIINLVATVRAYFQFLTGGGKKQEKKIRKAEKARVQTGSKKQLKSLAWSKTDHVFLDQSVLRRYHRNVGDVLLERGYISPEDLKDALQNKGEALLGSYLVRRGLVSEIHLLVALSSVRMTPCILEPDLRSYDVTNCLRGMDADFLRSLSALPLLKLEDGYVFGFTPDTPEDAPSLLADRLNGVIYPVYMAADTMERAWADLSHIASHITTAKRMMQEGRINYEQYILVRNISYSRRYPEAETLRMLGLRAVRSAVPVA